MTSHAPRPVLHFLDREGQYADLFFSISLSLETVLFATYLGLHFLTPFLAPFLLRILCL